MRETPPGPAARLEVGPRRGRAWWPLAWAGLLLAGIGVAFAAPRVASQPADFYFFGSQPTSPQIGGLPNPAFDEMPEANFCAGCHGEYDEVHEPFARWSHSMMAQSYRDPIFRAQLSITEQDASFSGDTCLRCHAPQGWFQGRATPTDGSGLNALDYEGVSCSTCHRAVDPVERPDLNPPPPPGQNTAAIDRAVLAALGANRPPNFANGGPLAANGAVIDPFDRRRGPYDLTGFGPHPWLESSFHRSSAMCASCHDVSNALFTRQGDGTYALGPLGQPHPTGNKHDMFPMDRTYSEWTRSSFAQGPVELGGRFGGNATGYSTCQDCHMPRSTGKGCAPFLPSPVRTDLARHEFAGANSWVLRAVRDLYPDALTGLNAQGVEEAIERNRQMLRAATDLEAVQAGSQLSVRVINQGGHKFPAGFSEGRRAWVNVKFFGPGDVLLAESGAYDAANAVLDEAGTKVYKATLGIDAALAATPGVNLPAGPSFHLDLNNVILFDNRIPPRGFTNAGFAAVQAAPVAYAYADGQHWDDTLYPVPPGAVRAEVRVFHQTTTRDYIEFLRDRDTTIPYDRDVPWGTLAYDQWVQWGKSAPVEMDALSLTLTPTCKADFNGDTALNDDDLSEFVTAYFEIFPGPGRYAVAPCDGVDAPYDALGYQADWTQDCSLNDDDLGAFITAYFQACE